MSDHPDAIPYVEVSAAVAAAETKLYVIIFAVIALAAAIWAGLTVMFGLVGFTMVALALVPVIYIAIIMMTLGK